MLWLLYRQLLEEFGLLFISTSGHTDYHIKIELTERQIITKQFKVDGFGIVSLNATGRF